MFLVGRKMSNKVDVLGLIAEVRKRPALWDVHHLEKKDRIYAHELWREVAKHLGLDVQQCKRKWKNIRDTYRAEIRRSKRRVERDKLKGTYDSNTSYNRKWVYFSALSFLGENRQSSGYSIENENTSSNSNDNQHQQHDERHNESLYEENDQRAFEIKSEPNYDDDTANDILFKEFESFATPQAARRLSATLTINNSLEQMSVLQQSVNDNSSNSKTAQNCKCSKRIDDQVNFLADLGREEKKLIKSTRQDIRRSNNLDHVGDSDYNFLVSFLPQMKKMSELQNLQFRAKMCKMLLTILAPSLEGDTGNSSGVQSIGEPLILQATSER